jgi:hypothetical protein
VLREKHQRDRDFAKRGPVSRSIARLRRWSVFVARRRPLARSGAHRKELLALDAGVVGQVLVGVIRRGVHPLGVRRRSSAGGASSEAGAHRSRAVAVVNATSSLTGCVPTPSATGRRAGTIPCRRSARSSEGPCGRLCENYVTDRAGGASDWLSPARRGFLGLFPLDPVRSQMGLCVRICLTGPL